MHKAQELGIKRPWPKLRMRTIAWRDVDVWANGLGSEQGQDDGSQACGNFSLDGDLNRWASEEQEKSEKKEREREKQSRKTKSFADSFFPSFQLVFIMYTFFPIRFPSPIFFSSPRTRFHHASPLYLPGCIAIVEH